MKKGNNKSIQVPVPAIGQPQIDVSQAATKDCKSCGLWLYAEEYRRGIVSSLAAGNNTGQDVPIKIPFYVCVGCGLEFGKEKVDDV